MIVEKILEVLAMDAECWITFRSMTSNKEHTHLYKKSAIPSKGDKLIVVNVETNAIEDIEKQSIIHFNPLRSTL